MNNLAILLCLQPERDDIYETHKHILFSSGAASARETQTILEQQSIDLGGVSKGQIKGMETLEIFEYFKGLVTQKICRAKGISCFWYGIPSLHRL